MSILGYKQAPGSKIWKVIPELTLEHVDKVTRPRDNGLKDGHRNYPEADSHAPSGTEQKIVFEIENYLKKVEDIANKESTDILRQVESLSLAQIDDDFTDLKLAAEQEFNQYSLNIMPQLIKLRRNERTALRDLNRFRAENGLERSAIYPVSQVRHFGWICMLLILECALNMKFFAEGTDLGLAGGFFSAFIVSLVNIAFCVLFGWLGFNQLHHCRVYRKMLGGVAVLSWITLLMAYHLMVAHYRDLLVLDPDNAQSLALIKFFGDPFGIQTQEALMVFGIGVVSGIIATLKGYTADDHYPGYGRKDRQYRRHEAAYEAQEAALRAQMSSCLSTAEQAVQKRLTDYQKRAAKIADLYNGSASVIGHFDNIYRQVNEIAHSAATTYREANLRVRTEAPPSSFSVSPVIERILQKEKWNRWLEDLRQTKELTERGIRGLKTYASQVKAELVTAMASTRDRLDGLAEEVDKKAEQQIERNRAEVWQ